MVNHIKGIIDEKGRTAEKKDGDLPSTVFHTLLESNLPEEEKSLERLWQEAQLIIGAGTDTVANALTVTTFHVLNNQEILARLRMELEDAIPDRDGPVKLLIVEQLPYLVSIFPEFWVLEAVALAHECWFYHFLRRD